MSMRWLIAGLLGVLACGDEIPPSEEPLGGSRTITGDVVDLQTGEPVRGAASVTTSALLPAPRVTVRGATYTLEGVPDNSTFQILASSPPDHRPTFGPSIEVLTEDLTGIDVPVASEAFLAEIAAGFGVSPTAARGVLIAQLTDSAGAPRSGIPAAELVIAGGVDGPHFLDANLAAAPNATESSASGYVVFFEVPPGIVTLGQAANATVTLQMPASPVNPAGVTITRVVVTDGPPPVTANILFARDIVPIFGDRGCVACHSGGGIGKDLGGLKLDGPATQVYSELVTEDPTRVLTANPDASLILTMPSSEAPPDRHPNVTFTGPTDPDYVKLLVWIREGAREN